MTSLGFAVKSGWTAVVLLAGSARSPEVIDSRRIELSDPNVPEARQPHHDGFGTARKSGPELTRLLNSVHRYGRRSVGAVIKSYRDSGHQLRSAGLVVGSTIDPDTIANEHMRIHALEGRLFRSIIERELDRREVESSVWRERDLYPFAARTLKRSDDELRAALTALRPTGGATWRAEQKAAALAAWVLLSSAPKLR